jgi:hypothetical protein
MSQGTVQLGDGIGDPGIAYIQSLNGDTDITSPWYTPDTYLSGGYTGGGSNVASTVRAARISNLQLRLGGTAASGTIPGTADGFLEISPDAAGNGTILSSQIGLTSTTGTYSTGTISYNVDTSVDYFYGFDCVTGTGGNFVFARSVDGTGFTYKDGTQTHTGSISGQLTYQTIPSKPQSISASNVLQTTFTLNWTAPADDGVQDPSGYSAANIRGYRIVYKKSSETNWQVHTANTGTSALTRSITGLLTGTQYNFQVSALNAVTESHNASYASIGAIVGERSNILTLTTLTSAPKVWNGTVWTTSTLKVWNGSAWVNGDIRVWNGTAWTPLTPPA